MGNKRINIVVMSRKQFEKYAAEKHRLTSAVISISSIDEAPPIVNGSDNSIISILKLQFNDTDSKEQNAFGIGNWQAIQIANFVRPILPLVDKLIIHCGAGQSRSAGVAAAILKYYTNDDSEIFEDRKYTPNMLCYRRVLEAMLIG